MRVLADIVNDQIAEYDMIISAIKQDILSCQAGMDTLQQVLKDTLQARNDMANSYGAFQAAILS